jgi:hypothetical protein
VLANRVFRRLILGFAVSYLEDGMSFVAVAWLAIGQRPRRPADPPPAPSRHERSRNVRHIIPAGA